MMRRLDFNGRTYLVYGASIEVRVERGPGVMRNGFVQWRRVPENGPTAKAVRAELARRLAAQKKEEAK